MSFDIIEFQRTENNRRRNVKTGKKDGKVEGEQQKNI